MVPSPTQIITSSCTRCTYMDDAKTGTHAFTILADPRLEMERPKNVFLNMWRDSLSEELEITTARTQQAATPHKLMLHLAYWWLVILLHRPLFYRKSRPNHSTDSGVVHAKVCSPFFKKNNLRETYTTFTNLDISTSCRKYYGAVIYLTHPLQTPLLPSHPPFKRPSLLVLYTF